MIAASGRTPDTDLVLEHLVTHLVTAPVKGCDPGLAGGGPGREKQTPWWPAG
jgi:hypothetical protein